MMFHIQNDTNLRQLNTGLQEIDQQLIEKHYLND